jgi:putative protease
VDEPGVVVEASSNVLLEAARTAPLSGERLTEHLGKLKDTRYQLTTLTCNFPDPVILPIAELNRLRRKLVESLEQDYATAAVRRDNQSNWRDIVLADLPEEKPHLYGFTPTLSVLCRDKAQIQAALECGVNEVLLDFEDVRNYHEAVAFIKSKSKAQVWVATPRIQKASEQGFFKLIENSAPDGVLVRNLGAMDFFNRSARPRTLRLLGDFSLNIANPVTACEFLKRGLERVTASYDLTASQVIDLTLSLPDSKRDKLQLTLHQHMPMFHMEHCVFAAFLSKGTSHLDCGRPCERHRVHLMDRVGVRHPLRADVGCRNTLFNAKAQTGAAFYDSLFSAGIRHFRIELLEEDAAESQHVIKAYQKLLRNEEDGSSVGKNLNAVTQLGVTSGTLAARESRR